jgi:antitoxin VapB
MVLRIDHPDANRLAQELAELTGEPLDAAVVMAVSPRLKRVRDRLGVRDELGDLIANVSTYPVLNALTPEQIIGYDEDGLPT